MLPFNFIFETVLDLKQSPLANPFHHHPKNYFSHPGMNPNCSKSKLFSLGYFVSMFFESFSISTSFTTKMYSTVEVLEYIYSL